MKIYIITEESLPKKTKKEISTDKTRLSDHQLCICQESDIVAIKNKNTYRIVKHRFENGVFKFATKRLFIAHVAKYL